MGDSVLGFIITKMLFDRYEKEQEGFLTKARTKLVRGATLAHVARYLNLDRWVLMDDKGSRNGWMSNDKILEDVFEALVGAIYLDLGLLYAKRFVLDIFNNPEIIDMNKIMIDDNFKDQLMRYCQQSKIPLPVYTVESHDSKTFTVSVTVNGSKVGVGSASTKKQAEQNAAQYGLKILGII